MRGFCTDKGSEGVKNPGNVANVICTSLFSEPILLQAAATPTSSFPCWPPRARSWPASPIWGGCRSTGRPSSPARWAAQRTAASPARSVSQRPCWSRRISLSSVKIHLGRSSYMQICEMSLCSISIIFMASLFKVSHLLWRTK